MIDNIFVIPAGNALRVFFTPPSGAELWRLLRKTEDTFSGADDPAAYQVIETSEERSVLDYVGLVNGATYHYRLYARVSGVWQASATRQAVPDAEFQAGGTDVLALLLERINDGLKVYTTRGDLVPDQNRMRIQVLTAPPTFEDTDWPVVTIHLDSDAPAEHGIGAVITGDDTLDGWYSLVRCSVIVWSLNSDERNAMRQAIKAIVIANLGVFADAGLARVEVSMSDSEDTERYPAPVYQSIGTFTCLAPSVVSGDDYPIINSIPVTVLPVFHP